MKSKSRGNDEMMCGEQKKTKQNVQQSILCIGVEVTLANHNQQNLKTPNTSLLSLNILQLQVPW